MLLLLLLLDSDHGFRFHHEIEEILPDQLGITIYETSIDQSDSFQLLNSELYIPNPTLTCGQYGTSFHLDPRVYDFR